ncbi:unnamed protein product [Amoebophrya sp. A120]|nr:unnamed protein product [Amoebophrya sp. A120]|eukprot:GSA120T00003331001.1
MMRAVVKIRRRGICLVALLLDSAAQALFGQEQQEEIEIPFDAYTEESDAAQAEKAAAAAPRSFRRRREERDKDKNKPAPARVVPRSPVISAPPASADDSSSAVLDDENIQPSAFLENKSAGSKLDSRVGHLPPSGAEPQFHFAGKDFSAHADPRYLDDPRTLQGDNLEEYVSVLRARPLGEALAQALAAAAAAPDTHVLPAVCEAAVLLNGNALEEVSKYFGKLEATAHYGAPSTNALITLTKHAVEKGTAAVYSEYGFRITPETLTFTAVRTSPLMLKFAPNSMQNDPDFVDWVVRLNGHALEFASEEVKKNRDVITSAILTNATSLQFADTLMREDRHLCDLAIRTNGTAIQHCAPHFRGDVEFALQAIGHDMRAPAVVYEDTGKQDWEPFLKHDTDATEHGRLTQQMKALRDLASSEEATAETCALYHLDAELRCDHDLVYMAVANRGRCLVAACDEAKMDPFIVETALFNTWRAAAYVKPEFWASPEGLSTLRFFFVVSQGGIYPYLPDALKQHPTFQRVAVGAEPIVAYPILPSASSRVQYAELAIVRSNGYALKFMDTPEFSEKYAELVRLALGVNGLALQFVDRQRLPADEQKYVCYDAVLQTPLAWQYCSDAERRPVATPSFLRQLLLRDGRMLEHLPDTVRQDPEMVSLAVRDPKRAHMMQFASAALRNDVLFLRQLALRHRHIKWMPYVFEKPRADIVLAEMGVTFMDGATVFKWMAVSLCADKELAYQAVVVNEDVPKAGFTNSTDVSTGMKLTKRAQDLAYRYFPLQLQHDLWREALYVANPLGVTGLLSAAALPPLSRRLTPEAADFLALGGQYHYVPRPVQTRRRTEDALLAMGNRGETIIWQTLEPTLVDKSLVVFAVAQMSNNHGTVLNALEPHLRNDKEIREMAVTAERDDACLWQGWQMALTHLDPVYRDDKGLVYEALGGHSCAKIREEVHKDQVRNTASAAAAQLAIEEGYTTGAAAYKNSGGDAVATSRAYQPVLHDRMFDKADLMLQVAVGPVLKNDWHVVQRVVRKRGLRELRAASPAIRKQVYQNLIDSVWMGQMDVNVIRLFHLIEEADARPLAERKQAFFTDLQEHKCWDTLSYAAVMLEESSEGNDEDSSFKLTTTHVNDAMKDHKNVMEYKYLSEELRKDAVLLSKMTTASKTDGDVAAWLPYAPESVRSHAGTMRVILRRNGRALRFAAANVKRDPALVAIAVENDPSAVVFASRDLALKKAAEAVAAKTAKPAVGKMFYLHSPLYGQAPAPLDAVVKACGVDPADVFQYMDPTGTEKSLLQAEVVEAALGSDVSIFGILPVEDRSKLNLLQLVLEKHVQGDMTKAVELVRHAALPDEELETLVRLVLSTQEKALQEKADVDQLAPVPAEQSVLGALPFLIARNNEEVVRLAFSEYPRSTVLHVHQLPLRLRRSKELARYVLVSAAQIDWGATSLLSRFATAVREDRGIVEVALKESSLGQRLQTMQFAGAALRNEIDLHEMAMAEEMGLFPSVMDPPSIRANRNLVMKALQPDKAGAISVFRFPYLPEELRSDPAVVTKVLRHQNVVGWEASPSVIYGFISEHLRNSDESLLREATTAWEHARTFLNSLRTNAAMKHIPDFSWKANRLLRAQSPLLFASDVLLVMKYDEIVMPVLHTLDESPMYDARREAHILRRVLQDAAFHEGESLVWERARLAKDYNQVPVEYQSDPRVIAHFLMNGERCMPDVAAVGNDYKLLSQDNPYLLELARTHMFSPYHKLDPTTGDYPKADPQTLSRHLKALGPLTDPGGAEFAAMYTPMALQHLDAKSMSSDDIRSVFAAVLLQHRVPAVMQFAPPELRSDPVFFLQMVHAGVPGRTSLPFATIPADHPEPERLYELAREVMKHDAKSLDAILPWLLKLGAADKKAGMALLREVFELAIRENCRAYMLAPMHLKSDVDFLRSALTSCDPDQSIAEKIPHDVILKNPEILSLAMDTTPALTQYNQLSEQLKNGAVIMERAIARFDPAAQPPLAPAAQIIWERRLVTDYVLGTYDKQAAHTPESNQKVRSLLLAAVQKQLISYCSVPTTLPSDGFVLKDAAFLEEAIKGGASFKNCFLSKEEIGSNPGPLLIRMLRRSSYYGADVDDIVKSFTKHDLLLPLIFFEEEEASSLNHEHDDHEEEGEHRAAYFKNMDSSASSFLSSASAARTAATDVDEKQQLEAPVVEAEKQEKQQPVMAAPVRSSPSLRGTLHAQQKLQQQQQQQSFVQVQQASTPPTEKGTGDEKQNASQGVEALPLVTNGQNDVHFPVFKPGQPNWEFLSELVDASPRTIVVLSNENVLPKSLRCSTRFMMMMFVDALPDIAELPEDMHQMMKKWLVGTRELCPEMAADDQFIVEVIQSTSLRSLNQGVILNLFFDHSKTMTERVKRALILVNKGFLMLDRYVKDSNAENRDKPDEEADSSQDVADMLTASPHKSTALGRLFTTTISAAMERVKFRKERYWLKSLFKRNIPISASTIAKWEASMPAPEDAQEALLQYDIARCAVADAAQNYHQLGSTLKRDKRILTRAVRFDYDFYEQSDPNFKSTLASAPWNLRDDLEILEHALATNGLALRYAFPEEALIVGSGPLHDDGAVEESDSEEGPLPSDHPLRAHQYHPHEILPAELLHQHDTEVENKPMDRPPRYPGAKPPAASLLQLRQAASNVGYLNQGYLPDELYLTACAENGLALAYVPLAVRLRNPGEAPGLLMIAVEEDGMALRYVPSALRTWELLDAAVRENGLAVQFATAEHVFDVSRYKTLMMQACGQRGTALEFAGADNLRDMELILECVRNDGMALQFVPVDLRTEEVNKAALQSEGRAIRFVQPKQDRQRTDYIRLAAVTFRGALCYGSWHDRQDVELIGQIAAAVDKVRARGGGVYNERLAKDNDMGGGFRAEHDSLLKCVPPPLRYDDALLDKLLVSDSKNTLLEFFYNGDGKFMSTMPRAPMPGSSTTFSILPRGMLTAERVLMALQQDGFALSVLRITKHVWKWDFARTAVMRDGISLGMVSHPLRDELDIVLAACENDGTAIKYASERLQTNPIVRYECLHKDLKAREKFIEGSRHPSHLSGNMDLAGFELMAAPATIQDDDKINKLQKLAIGAAPMLSRFMNREVRGALWDRRRDPEYALSPEIGMFLSEAEDNAHAIDFSLAVDRPLFSPSQWHWTDGHENDNKFEQIDDLLHR